MDLPIHFDADSGVPLYRQLSDRMEELIRTGRFGRGDKLPALREVAAQLKLNRTTVAAAYERLEESGLIRTDVGRGTFVAGTPEPLRTALSERINFAVSRPSEDLFPLSEFRTSCNEVLAGTELRTLLQLGSPRGYEPLRAWVREFESAGPDDDVLITSGCQQAYDLLCREFVRPGAKIALEELVNPGLKTLFAEARAEILPLTLTHQGVDLASLRKAFEAGAKLAIVTPSFQNPTGSTMPEANRREAIALAREFGAVLVENDIYRRLRYVGEELPRLKSLAPETVLLGSFSKVAFPGVRCGWIVGPKPLIARLAEQKQMCDLHSDQLSQAFLLRFAESGRLNAHIGRMIGAGRARVAALAQACSKYLTGCRFHIPEGGMNIWIDLPDGVDASALRGLAQQVGIDYLPGRYFAVAATCDSALRLSFAGVDPVKIDRGIERLGSLVRAAAQAREDAREEIGALI